MIIYCRGSNEGQGKEREGKEKGREERESEGGEG